MSRPVQLKLKRMLDVLVSLSGLLLLSPLLLLISIATSLSVRGEILFSQLRTGVGTAPFHIYKFRTMKDATDDRGVALPDTERITPIGGLLRRTSLDELPGLWNVLIGEMSLVGPRPFIHEYVDLYDDKQRRRFEMRGGITGWAQVNGRNSISWEEKFELDVWYVDNWSLLLDLRILIRTVRKVAGGHAVDSDASETMVRFTGTEPVSRTDR